MFYRVGKGEHEWHDVNHMSNKEKDSTKTLTRRNSQRLCRRSCSLHRLIYWNETEPLTESNGTMHGNREDGVFRTRQDKARQQQQDNARKHHGPPTLSEHV